MSKTNVSSLGRFSSQMLTYLGTQRTVKTVTGMPANTFKYSSGDNVFVNPGSLSQAVLGAGVSGSYSLNDYNSVKCFFLSRGASSVYADTMTALVIDMSLMLGVTPQSLLEQSTAGSTFSFSETAYRSMNVLRDSGNQLGKVTSIDNRYSLQSRQIRS